MCVFWVRGAPDGRKGRAVCMCERARVECFFL